jgi:hypothetical protein
MGPEPTIQGKQDEIRAQTHAIVGKSAAPPGHSDVVLDVPVTSSNSQRPERSS